MITRAKRVNIRMNVSHLWKIYNNFLTEANSSINIKRMTHVPLKYFKLNYLNRRNKIPIRQITVKM